VSTVVNYVDWLAVDAQSMHFLCCLSNTNELILYLFDVEGTSTLMILYYIFCSEIGSSVQK